MKHTGKLTNMLVQSEHATRIMHEYRTKLIAEGFRFFDDDSFAAPEGTKIEDAMRRSIAIWKEVNGDIHEVQVD